MVKHNQVLLGSLTDCVYVFMCEFRMDCICACDLVGCIQIMFVSGSLIQEYGVFIYMIQILGCLGWKNWKMNKM